MWSGLGRRLRSGISRYRRWFFFYLRGVFFFFFLKVFWVALLREGNLKLAYLEL